MDGGLSADRRRAARSLSPTDRVLAVDAHRHLRGPYSAGGAVLRALVPEVLERDADLVRRHDIEILSIAPELRQVVPATRETLTSLAIPEERTRFYASVRTLRMANGVAEFLRDAQATQPGLRIVVENADRADPTDAELLAVLLRRMDPATVQLVVCSTARPDHPGLSDALDRYVTRVDVVAEANVDADRPVGSAVAFVASDGAGDDPADRAAYDALPAESRAELHDARAEELDRAAEVSLTLGAIPYHRERGSDPSGAGVTSLLVALNYCIDMGFYDATIDVGLRGLDVLVHDDEVGDWWIFTTKMTTSLAALGRADEAQILYDNARASTTRASVHLQAAYATAMLYTRHHDDSIKNHAVAKAWINQAIAISGLLPDAQDRAFHGAFARNGLALIEVHLGHPQEALRLVDECLARLDSELSPGQHRLHRSVLRYNRAQVWASLGDWDRAIEDYNAIIDDDPNYAEYHFDRANLQRKRGMHAEAMADYDRALHLSPPFPEVLYNRADLLLAEGETDAGVAGLNAVLDIDPEFLDALVNRAGLLAELGHLDQARLDAETGLRVSPDHPHLLTVLGQISAAEGDEAASHTAYSAAIALDPTMGAAWAGRASLAYDAGDVEGAVADLSQALTHGEDPMLLFNRGIALQACGRDLDARRDLERAHELDPDDADVAEALSGLLAV